MKRVMNRILTRRAAALAGRLEPWIEPGCRVLDIGSGTGHNAAVLAGRCRCAVDQVDVTDMSVVGPPPQLFNGRDLPFDDAQYNTGLLLFVLHYANDPAGLLGEAHRVLARRLVVIQSTYQTKAGLAVLFLREWLEGRFAFRIACRIGLVRPGKCSLEPQGYMTRERLEVLFREAGWVVRKHQSEAWPGVRLNRDLYILEKT